MSNNDRPVDPNAPFGLEGHVVTMNGRYDRLERGVVYVAGGMIVRVIASEAPPPPGFEDAPVIASGGTIYPGLIELHNHLSYDVLPLWSVPRRFDDRDQWSGGAMQETYRKTISGPMTVLGRTPGLIEAVVRYAEAKCLLSGVTTSQGIALFSNQGAATYYQGVVRNVERNGGDGLPPAGTRISDVEATDADAFLRRLQRSSCLLLHLAEGTGDAAREHFLSLHRRGDEWAITKALAGIHCVALQRADFDVMAMRNAAMVWSPLSNLLLYGATARIDQAKAAGLAIGVGSDWSPSGSKNLLGELKAARLSDPGGDVFSDRQLIALATREAARILGWDTKLGTIQTGKRADLLVLNERAGDPYQRLLHATETSVQLVVIDGVPRYGATNLMSRFELIGATERWTVNSSNRLLNLQDPAGNPVVGALSLSEAKDRLEDAMGRLADLARDLEHPSGDLAARLVAGSGTQWMLLLDHEEPDGLDQRPHLPGPDGQRTAELTLDLALAVKPLSELLEPIPLDPLTVADDGRFLDRIAAEPNLPNELKQALPDLY
jgi:5-methylthioadenosine/S-adenosylhomocysteine deaminase